MRAKTKPEDKIIQPQNGLKGGTKAGAAALAILMVSCAATASRPPPGSTSGSTTRWYIYRDGDSPLKEEDPNANHGVWTNWMPDRSGETFTLNLVDQKDPHEGSTCVEVHANLEDLPNRNWGGIAVASCPDCWGKCPTPAAFDLRNAVKLVFWAKGNQGGERIQVKVAIAGDQPCGDSVRLPAATPWITLTNRWAEYELPLAGNDLSRVITPFMFVTDRAHNPGEPFTFYLDDIYFVLEDGK